MGLVETEMFLHLEGRLSECMFRFNHSFKTQSICFFRNLCQRRLCFKTCLFVCLLFGRITRKPLNVIKLGGKLGNVPEKKDVKAFSVVS